jgi:Ca2+-dependent lipid-binding protein
MRAELTHDTDPMGKMDPYVRLTYNGVKFETRVAKKGHKNPAWKDSFSFMLSGDGSLKVEVWDKDTMSADDLVGDTILNLFQLAQQGNVNQMHPIYFQGTVAGNVYIEIQTIRIGQGPQIIIKPLRAELTRDTDTFGKMDPFIRLIYEGQEYNSSVCYKGGKTPVWNDTLVFPLTGSGAVRFIVLEKDGSDEDLVGDTNINLHQMATAGNAQAIEISYKGKKAGVVYLHVTGNK